MSYSLNLNSGTKNCISKPAWCEQKVVGLQCGGVWNQQRIVETVIDCIILYF